MSPLSCVGVVLPRRRRFVSGGLDVVWFVVLDEVIDQLVEKVEAESRSQLCRVAMEWYFAKGAK